MTERKNTGFLKGIGKFKKVEYHLDGCIKSIYPIDSNGLKNGTEKGFASSGLLISESIYKNGVLIKEIKYNATQQNPHFIENELTYSKTGVLIKHYYVNTLRGYDVKEYDPKDGKLLTHKRYYTSGKVSEVVEDNTEEPEHFNSAYYTQEQILKSVTGRIKE